MLKTETLNAERAIANSNQTGKAANRMDEVKGRMLRRPPRLVRSGEFTAKFICSERSSPSRFAKISFGGGFSAILSGSSAVFENQDTAIFQMDFGRLPCLALVEAIRVGIRWVPRTVELIQVGFVVRDPFLDGSPRRHNAL
jgi:hypothetical protein